MHRRGQVGFLLRTGNSGDMDLRVIQFHAGLQGVVLVRLVVVNRILMGRIVLLGDQRGVVGHVDAEFQLLLWRLRAFHQR